MSQKLPVNGFEWVEKLSKFDEGFIKKKNKKKNDVDNTKGYFLEVDVEYQKKLFDLHNDLLFSPERKKIGKCNKLVCDFYDRKNYVAHIKASKQALNNR